MSLKVWALQLMSLMIRSVVMIRGNIQGIFRLRLMRPSRTSWQMPGSRWMSLDDKYWKWEVERSNMALRRRLRFCLDWARRR